MRSALLLHTAGIAVLLNGMALGASLSYELHPAGFTDSIHTRSDGYRQSVIRGFNAVGQVAGTSKRYNGSSDVGTSAWLMDPNTFALTRLGYVGPDYTRADGYQSSGAGPITDSGLVFGSSTRYAGSGYIGQHYWVFSSTSAQYTPVGFYDAQHTRADGLQEGIVRMMNQAGQVAGYSSRFSGMTTTGATAFLYDPATQTTTIQGLTDAEHTSASGLNYNAPSALNERGDTIGSAPRFSGEENVGYSVWFDPTGSAPTRRIGFFDAAHTRSDGFRETYSYSLSNAGYAAGISSRFSGLASAGTSAWVYDPIFDQTRRIGFFDAAHTDNSGNQNSSVDRMNSSGQTIGKSNRYSPNGSWLGRDGWLYNSATETHVQLGLTDAEHTDASGRRDSWPSYINNAGHVGGTSDRYVESNTASNDGTTVWIYNADTQTTRRTGLTDARHTAGDGQRASEVNDINAAGYAIGSSNRYRTGVTYPDSRGLSGWFYDPTTDQTTELTFSQTSAGDAYCEPYYLDDDGTVLGTYRLYSNTNADLGLRGFLWTQGAGFADLGALVNGGLAGNGWQVLEFPDYLTSNGRILGRGRLLGQPDGSMTFVLVPIPEPSMLGLLPLLLLSRRSR